jgi:hypothetical protein
VENVQHAVQSVLVGAVDRHDLGGRRDVVSFAGSPTAIPPEMAAKVKAAIKDKVVLPS